MSDYDVALIGQRVRLNRPERDTRRGSAAILDGCDPSPRRTTKSPPVELPTWP
jgi:hypothetical protein